MKLRVNGRQLSVHDSSTYSYQYVRSPPGSQQYELQQVVRSIIPSCRDSGPPPPEARYAIIF